MIANAVNARGERGVTLLMVLILLTVMMLGALLAARFGSIDTVLAGNAARLEAGASLSDVGIATALQDVRELTNDNVDQGGWYFATRQADDAAGIPAVDWETAPRVLQVGGFEVGYVVDRQCSVAPVTDETRQCLLKQNPSELTSATAGTEPLLPPSLRTYRVTVRVAGPKNSVVWVQSLLAWRPLSS